jgi:hypothetical protein
MRQTTQLRRGSMLSIDEINAYYDYLSKHTSDLLPDGIVNVDVKLLQSLSILSPNASLGSASAKELLQAIESGGRITLFNDHYVLWIVPQNEVSPPSTTVILARCDKNSIKPEVGFKTAGIHNQSKTILQLIDRYLVDIQETEDVLEKFEQTSQGKTP